MVQLKKKDKLYYARALPTTRVYEVCELTVRTVEGTWFVGIDKDDKRAYLFSYSALGKTVFRERGEALAKVLMEEEKAPPINDNEE